MKVPRSVLAFLCGQLIACPPFYYDVDDAGTEDSDVASEGKTCDDGSATEATGMSCESGSMCDTAGEWAREPCIQDADCLDRAEDSGCQIAVCDVDGRCATQEVEDGLECDDGDLCTLEDVCLAGECHGQRVECDGLSNPCRIGFCNPDSGNCAADFLPDETPCDEGSDCSQGSTCSLGQCVAASFISEDFLRPDDWTFDPPWEFGPATASTCAALGAEDPAADQSAGRDEFVAGVAIGDCVPDIILAEPACLTSSTVPEASRTSGSVWLHYWSTLSNGAAPMRSTVEVFAGQSWIEIEIADALAFEESWTEHTVDISEWVNADIRVRFCYETGGAVADPAVGGWSVDDVTIGPPVCDP